MKCSKMLSSIIIVLTAFLDNAGVFAQDQKGVEITGQIRLRAEFDNRDFNQNTSAYNYNLLRTRLNLKKNITENISAVVQFQDSRAYGSEVTSPEEDTRKSIDNVDLHLGYVRLDEFVAPWFSLQFGRMELSYGNQRLLSRNGWSNTGRAFDGVLSSITLKHTTVDLFAASLYESQPKSFKEPAVDDGDVSLYGLWAKINSMDVCALDIYLLHDRDFQKDAQSQPQMLRTTIGALARGTVNGFHWSLEGDYQFGKINYTTSMAAFYVVASVGYTFDSAYKPGISIGYDYLSGDNPDTESYETFNTLYPSRHRYFGYMDYIRNIPGDVQDAGINDLIISGKLSPVKNLTINLDAHIFHLSQDVTTATDKISTAVGKELDLTFSYNIQNGINVSGGACVLQPDEVFKAWKGKNSSFWYYVQMTVNF